MSLREFLKTMESEDEVLHITEKVLPRFEISAIMKSFEDGPILHFEDVEDYETRVIGNVCATRSRICSALEVSEKKFYQRMMETCKTPKTPKIVEEAR